MLYVLARSNPYLGAQISLKWISFPLRHCHLNDNGVGIGYHARSFLKHPCATCSWLMLQGKQRPKKRGSLCHCHSLEGLFTKSKKLLRVFAKPWIWLHLYTSHHAPSAAFVCLSPKCEAPMHFTLVQCSHTSKLFSPLVASRCMLWITTNHIAKTRI